MKKIMMGFFFALATMALLLSCKKEMNENNFTIADDAYVKNLKTWYESVPSDTKSKIVKVNGVTTKVDEIPIWDETRYYPEDNTTITPIKIGQAKHNSPVYKYLVAKRDKKGLIVDVNYYRLVEGKNKPTNKFLEINNLNFISKIIADKDLPNDFGGFLLKYSGNNILLNTTTFKNGLKFSPNKIQNRPGEAEQNYAPIECTEIIIDSWWVEYVNGQIVSIEYLYSTAYTVCPPGGGGGGGGGNTTSCSALFSNMYSSTMVTSAIRSITVIDETTTTRTALYEWGCLVNNFAGWIIYSTEKAVHIKTNNPDPNLQWQFQSATHQGIALVGIVAGGSVEPSVTASNFTMGLYNMHVYLSLSTKYSLVCSGFPLSVTKTDNPHRGFNINQGQP